MAQAQKKALVTGGAGFIGSHLAEALAGRGYAVGIVDDLSTGKMANIANLLKEGSAQLYRGSVTDAAWLQDLCRGVDTVFHLAAVVSVAGSIRDPLTAHATNLTGTLNVLLAARDSGVRRVVTASSAAVYGDNPVTPQREDLLPAPLSPYGVTKLAAEHYCRVFQEVYGLTTVCLRYFNVYGPRQDPGSEYAGVIPRFIQRALERKPATIYGDGEQTRDFVFVKDVVEANILAAEKGAAGIYNTGSGTALTINRLAEMVGEAAGLVIPPVYEPARTGDIRYSTADITRAQGFGYTPRGSLAEHLAGMVRDGRV